MMDFYSARLLFVWVDRKPRKKNIYEESILVFRAKDFDDALNRAMAIGKERSKLPGTKFVEVETLDWVGKKVDGMEVASKLRYRISTKAISTKTRFYPEKSKPEGSF
jgi:hypothetical protein